MVQSTRRSSGRGSSSTPRTARRKRVWFFHEGATVHTGVDVKAVDILTMARASLGVGGFPGWTLETIIGQIYTDLDTVVTGNIIDARYGIVPGTQGQGSANLPVPYTDEGDFIWTDTNFAIVILQNQQGYYGKQRDVRTRAKRKLEEVEDTLWMVTRQNDGTAVNIRWRLRILLLAP